MSMQSLPPILGAREGVNIWLASISRKGETKIPLRMLEHPKRQVKASETQLFLLRVYQKSGGNAMSTYFACFFFGVAAGAAFTAVRLVDDRTKEACDEIAPD